MIGILIIGVPLLVYVIGAYSVAKKDVTNPDDFFVAFRRVGVTAFSSSSIAYAFQVGTIYPFLLWGASGFYFIPAVNALCWGLGIFFFSLCYNRFARFIGKDITLHGFLGEQYGKSVRVIASYITIVAFLGFAIAETYFGSKVLLSVITEKNMFYLVVIIALMFVYGYIAYGGQLSSIRTDQLQLIISYIGVFGLLLYFLFIVITNKIVVSDILYFSLLLLAAYIIIVLIVRKFRFIKISEDSSRKERAINNMLNISITGILCLVFLSSLWILLVKHPVKTSTRFFNIEGFGIPGLLSLIILPLCFQFVDLSNWQRLLSVKPDHSSGDPVAGNIKRGLRIYAVESPFTWVIFIFFGLLAVTALPHFTFQDLLIDLPKSLIHSGNISENIFGYLFIVSILAIMLSSIDSFIMGIIFTFVYDSYKPTRTLLDRGNENLSKQNFKKIINAGRIFGLVAIVVGVAAFILFDKKIQNGGELFINLLLAFYSAQISFFPLIYGILFLKKKPSPFWANASMLIGSFIGITIGVYSVLVKPEWAWYPIILCFAASNIIFLLGYILSPKK